MEFLWPILLWGVVVACAPIGIWIAKGRISTLEDHVRQLTLRLETLEATALIARATAPKVTEVVPAPAPIQAPLPIPPKPSDYAQSFRPSVSELQSQPMKRETPPSAGVPSYTSLISSPMPECLTAQMQPFQPAVAQSGISAFPGWVVYALTGGRLFVTLGLLLLFIGAAMLLKYAAHTVTLPIGARFGGIGLVAAALIAFGNRQMRTSREFGIYVQGGGFGILFLSIFIAFKFYSLLAPEAAFALLLLIGAATFGLSILYDALPLAVMAVTGGFSAPLLASSGEGSYVELFGYYLLINLVIFAIAWKKTWRVLNMVGFSFTFVAGLLWGGHYYTPVYYPGIQSFLVLYFLLYTGIGLLYAWRATPRLLHPVDGSAVFGVPLVGFGLQLALTQSFAHGAMLSALAMGIFFAVLSGINIRSSRPGLALLAQIHAGMAVLFFTLVIALHFSTEVAAPLWAFEGTALLWILNRSRLRLYGYAGTLLIIGANLLMLRACILAAPNAMIVPAGLLSVTLFAASRQLTDARDFFTSNMLTDKILSGAGILWWLYAGVQAMDRFLPGMHPAMPFLLFYTVSAIAGWVAHRWLRITTLDWPAQRLLIVIIVTELIQAMNATTLYHPLMGMGAIALPLAFAALYAWLGQENAHAPSWQHMFAFITGTLLCGSELGYWLGSTNPGLMDRADGWMLATAAGMALLLSPMKDRSRLFAGMNGETFSRTLLILSGWLVLLCLYSFTQPAGLSERSYNPLFNCTEPSEMLAIAVLLLMKRRIDHEHSSGSAVGFTAGALAFCFINSVALRTASHALNLPYLSDIMFGSPLVQTLLTILWTVSAMGLMLASSRSGARIHWSAGACLLCIVVLKLFFVDLSNIGTLSRIVSFIGVGFLTLLLGYLAPMPPKNA